MMYWEALGEIGAFIAGVAGALQLLVHEQKKTGEIESPALVLNQRVVGRAAHFGMLQKRLTT